MKKTYIQPAAKVYSIAPAAALFNSVSVQSDTVDGSTNFSWGTDRFRRGSSWDEE